MSSRRTETQLLENVTRILSYEDRTLCALGWSSYKLHIRNLTVIKNENAARTKALLDMLSLPGGVQVTLSSDGISGVTSMLDDRVTLMSSSAKMLAFCSYARPVTDNRTTVFFVSSQIVSN